MGAYAFCTDNVYSRTRGVAADRFTDRERLGIPEDTILEAALDEYAEAAIEARRILSQAKL